MRDEQREVDDNGRLGPDIRSHSCFRKALFTQVGKLTRKLGNDISKGLYYGTVENETS